MAPRASAVALEALRESVQTLVTRVTRLETLLLEREKSDERERAGHTAAADGVRKALDEYNAEQTRRHETYKSDINLLRARVMALEERHMREDGQKQGAVWVARMLWAGATAVAAAAAWLAARVTGGGR